MEENSKFIPPRNIIYNYEYSYKDMLINNYYSYRCKHRNKCKIIIKIEKSELIKISENREKDKIKNIISSTEKNHICNTNNKDLKEYQLKGKKLKPDFLKYIIVSKIEKPFSFHYNNL